MENIKFNRGLRRKPHAIRLIIGSCLVLAMATVSSLSMASPARPFYMGFTPWAYEYTVEAAFDTYDFINKNSDIISHHLEEGVPWTEALAGKPYPVTMRNDWDGRKNLTKKSLKVFVSISPINLTRDGLAAYRGSTPLMSLPAAFQNKRFNDPQVKAAYLAYAHSVIEHFEPDYLAIAIEANALLENNPDAWPDFVELYTETYLSLKEYYPNLPVFFTAALHDLSEWKGNWNDGWSWLTYLWDYSDIAALSFYPHLQYPFDVRDPIAILDEVGLHTDKPIAIAETGYPAETMEENSCFLVVASDTAQQNIYYSLLDKARTNNYEFLILWAHRDYDNLFTGSATMPEGSMNWRDIGLLDQDGNARSSKSVWDVYLKLPTE